MDAESFKRKFLPYHQKLYRIAFRILLNENEAKDIVQDTYMKLWTKRDILSDINSTEAFAITVTKNLCLDYLRNRKRTEKYDPNMLEAESLVTSINMEIMDETEHIKKLIMNLPIQQRQILMFKDWDGYSNQEIENITGLTENNIRVILSRARKTVREQYFKLYAK